jgi:heterodisulfide reductase subunit D
VILREELETSLFFSNVAQQNIATMNGYGVKQIVTTCPHCFNTIKNEYPALGGNYEVLHHSTYLQQLINDGKLKVEGGVFKGKKLLITILVI